MYKVENRAPAVRIIPTAMGNVVIGPRSSKDGLVLQEATAKMLRRSQLRAGSKVAIEGETQEARAVLERANEFRRGFNMVGNLQPIVAKTPDPGPAIDRDEIAEAEAAAAAPVAENAPVAAPAPAAAVQPGRPPGGMLKAAKAANIRRLLDSSAELTPDQLRGEARKLLGNLPGGQIGRRRVEALLEAALNELHGTNG